MRIADESHEFIIDEIATHADVIPSQLCAARAPTGCDSSPVSFSPSPLSKKRRHLVVFLVSSVLFVASAQSPTLACPPGETHVWWCNLDARPRD